MSKSILFYDSTSKLINPADEAFNDITLVEVIIDKDKSIDDVITQVIHENLSLQEYINILIPACLGKVLSDFIGLRFACHIRCTDNINQHKNIFIYSFTGIKDYLLNENFNILKTKGVFLIDYNINSIINCCQEEKIFLKKENLIVEIKKLHISIPTNYQDNHSIANEWSIYRWAKTIDATDEDIERIDKIQNSNLFFKYLKVIYPIRITETLKTKELQINHKGNSTILYIDDEAEKGWKEIFETIFYDKNENIDFGYLDNELNGKTKTQIYDLALEIIEKDKVDLVILDFRLHVEDFENEKIEEITGYQLLKKIKEYNKGIQVIIFSATNKIWNLLALQEAGADGFILKESPENSINSDFTSQSILNMIQSVENCLNKKHLIEIYEKLTPLIERIRIAIKLPYYRYNLSVPQGKLDEYLNFLETAEKLLYSNSRELKFCFLQLVVIIEDIIKIFYISSDNSSSHYVEKSLVEKILCFEKINDNIVLKIFPISKWNKFQEGDYLIENNNKDYVVFSAKFDRIPFNYRLNCVLHYKYEIDLVKASAFSNLYILRSTSVAHLNENTQAVSKRDILSSIELLSILFN